MSTDNDRTYVWVRPASLHKQYVRCNSGSGVNSSSSSNNNNNVANKRRGAPGDEETWGWLPAFYCSENGDGGSVHHYTLLPLDGDIPIDESKYSIDEARTKSLLESGDLVLANSWEEVDFRSRSNGHHSESEEEYNYDNSSDDDSDDDADGVTAGGAAHFIDRLVHEPPSNLIELTHLHEPSVVHALRYRYQQSKFDMRKIYTDTGPILLAVNPFKVDETGKLYGEDCAEQYRENGERNWLEKRQGGNGDDERQSTDENHEFLGPHVYAVADRTFRTMLTRLQPVDSSGYSTPKVNNSNVRNPGLKTATPQHAEKINQSVLVSGESGAGKTVTTKLLMGYLARLSERPANDVSSTAAPRASLVASSDMSIERRVLESNPIMESFGNARTVRNDNSSRFGKYIEMKFSATGGGVQSSIDNICGNSSSCTERGKTQQHSSWGAILIGASIETYLLEKVRLVHQSPGERNYHIFYELFTLKYEEEDYDFLGTWADQSQEEKEESHHHSMCSREDLVNKFGLSQYNMEDFALINLSGTYDRRDGVSDASTFADLCRAMTVMGFTRDEQIDVFAVTAALLHASNLTFKKIGEQECALEDSFHLDCVADLLGISKEGLNQALCYYEIGVVRGEAHRKVLSTEQAKKGVDALIKATYGTMFVYLVGRINVSVSGGEIRGKISGGVMDRSGGSPIEASIGILDIFGFESFQKNSFEQLCINYCNEALQQQFNRFVLRNEQEEYNREGIPWTYIGFPENQDVLDLIDLKGSGILNMLHDQCRTPGASDKSFSLLMYEKCSSHSRFEATSRQVAQQLFAVHHYAGLVEYSVDGFVEKNRDELPKEGADLLLSSRKGFVKVLARDMLRPSSKSAPGKKPSMPARGGSSQRPTVGIQFSSQLHDLRCKIDKTSPHYIRCLKPNNRLLPEVFDAALIADQLRCSGVIEAVRVSRLGYPQRYSHSTFISRYRMLGTRAWTKKKTADKKYNPAKALVHAITKHIIKRTGENQENINSGIQVGKTKIFLRRHSYNMLEELRVDKITSSAIRIQTCARQIVNKKRYHRACSSILRIQCFVRRVRAKEIVTDMRRHCSSVIIQRTWRKYLAVTVFQSSKLVAIFVQVHYRGRVGRAKYKRLNRQRRAIQIQTYGRRYIAIKRFNKAIGSIVLIQCAIRCYRARLLLRLKKAEARDFCAVVQERDRLQAEVSTLKVELQNVKENAKLNIETPTEELMATISEKNREIDSLRLAMDLLSAQQASQHRELLESKETVIILTAERDAGLTRIKELELFNAELYQEINGISGKAGIHCRQLPFDLEGENNGNGQVLGETSKLKSINQTFNYLPGTNSNRNESSLLNAPSPVLTKFDCALETALHKIAQLEEDNQKLKAVNASLNNELVISLLGRNDDHDEINRITAPSHGHKNNVTNANNYAPTIPLTSVYTTATTDNMTADTEDEISKLREENQVLQKQLELLRGNQGVLPDIIGSDHEYDESVNPTDSGSEDKNSSSIFVRYVVVLSITVHCKFHLPYTFITLNEVSLCPKS
eukprot:CCRYP_000224-RB/>CCRYP_000224-RB protein AED:0.01 eAED:0.01 QI:97/1/1/1/1/1/2/2451/1530